MARWTLLCALFAATAAAHTLVIPDVTVYISSDQPPLARTTILIRDGIIISIGQKIAIPPGCEIVVCPGCTVMAGFWNTHVHFTEPKWDRAATPPPYGYWSDLLRMVLHSGFTTVVDTGSDLANTRAIRTHIESDHARGPRIFTAGAPIYPPDGIPYYVKRFLPPAALAKLAPPRDPTEAARAATRRLDAGADLLKLLTASWASPAKVQPMPEPIAAAAVAVAHRRGRLVFADPANREGLRVAIHAGVDVLAHPPADPRGIDDAFLRAAIAHRIALIPTLQFFAEAPNIAAIRRFVRRYHHLGGTLLFGTATGAVINYDISQEYRQLQLAGFTTPQILGMLTENPARLFRDDKERGRILPGRVADLTVLAVDPAVDFAGFFLVRFTIRHGQVIAW